MSDLPQRAKVIAFPGARKPPATKAAPQPFTPPSASAPGSLPTMPAGDPLTRMLDSLHPRVQAVLVRRDGAWGFYERQGATGRRRGVLASTSLSELLQILDKSSASASVAILAQPPSVLQPPRKPEDHPTMRQERITLSPWPHFDLALLLREGVPHYAICLDPGTTIYVAEEALPVVARFFDQS
ncbi:MAG: hypothetical protein MUF01_14870 [Bryobacterales bacterium]|nr:hypothetical protein [Bryobacterales bacterium]